MAILDHYNNDLLIKQKLNLFASDPDYWDFRKGAMRDAMHGLTQYPAMMVPEMQSQLIEIFRSVLGKNIKIVDPFVGSGTTLVSAMRNGIDYWGQDINPLAVLISLCKTGPFRFDELEDAVRRIKERVKKDRSWKSDINFPGIEKWFHKSTIRELFRIRNAIKKEEDLWVRRMLWVSLAETVRFTSNSRLSTFKLHIKSKQDLEKEVLSATTTFFKHANDSVSRVKKEAIILENKGLLKGQSYKGTTCIRLGKSNNTLPGDEIFDMLITSPPYGDGQTTVPYGQYSYLPLQWIDLTDITEATNKSILTSTHEIDSRSLGGLRRNAQERVETVLKESPTLSKYLEKLSSFPKPYGDKVAAFFADFGPVLDTICGRMRSQGYMVWTVGNRRVGNISQPLDDILTEMLEARGCSSVTKIDRMIPSKRMATRNSIAQTMRQEYVLILRAGDSR